MISLDLMKSSEVRKAGDQSNRQKNCTTIFYFKVELNINDNQLSYLRHKSLMLEKSLKNKVYVYLLQYHAKLKNIV